MFYHVKPLHQSISNATAEHSTALFPRIDRRPNSQEYHLPSQSGYHFPSFPRYASIPA
ncbi:uncharacterized protein K441DRAFT_670747, partial [Cenococcum geophilum 1.58]